STGGKTRGGRSAAGATGTVGARRVHANVPGKPGASAYRRGCSAGGKTRGGRSATGATGAVPTWRVHANVPGRRGASAYRRGCSTGGGKTRGGRSATGATGARRGRRVHTVLSVSALADASARFGAGRPAAGILRTGRVHTDLRKGGLAGCSSGACAARIPTPGHAGALLRTGRIYADVLGPAGAATAAAGAGSGSASSDRAYDRQESPLGHTGAHRGGGRAAGDGGDHGLRFEEVRCKSTAWDEAGSSRNCGSFCGPRGTPRSFCARVSILSAPISSNWIAAGAGLCLKRHRRRMFWRRSTWPESSPPWRRPNG